MNERANGILKSFLAGVAIALGGYVYLSCENKYVGAFLFSVGLLTVLYFGLNLYTGRIGYVFSQNRGQRLDTLISLPANVAGCVATGLLKAPVGTVRSIVAAKLAKPLPCVFADGILCGILIYICVDVFKKNKNPIAVLFCVPAFILCGFEHSIADAFYLANARVFSAEAIVFLLVVAAGNAVGSLLFGTVFELSCGTFRKKQA